jgi:hypothetical protein
MKKPSVTELLKLLDKPALLNWANKQGLAGIDISVKRHEWLNAGTSLHCQIENYVKNGTPFFNTSDQVLFEKFISDKEILGIEVNVEHDGYIGRYDLKIKHNGKTYIVDYKINHKTVYLENKLQLVAYGMADKCDSYAIVSVPDFKFIEVNIEDKTHYENIIHALVAIHNAKQYINGNI